MFWLPEPKRIEIRTTDHENGMKLYSAMKSAEVMDFFGDKYVVTHINQKSHAGEVIAHLQEFRVISENTGAINAVRSVGFCKHCKPKIAVGDIVKCTKTHGESGTHPIYKGTIGRVERVSPPLVILHTDACRVWASIEHLEVIANHA